MIKFILFGLMFGLGFWVGRVTDFLPEVDKTTDSVQMREKIFKDVQKRLELTYYSELIKKPEAQPVPESEPEPEPEPTQAPAPEPVSKSSPDKIAQALAKVLGSETPNSVKTVIKQTLPVATGSAYAVQVASLPNREAAQDLVKRLAGKGHAAKLVQAEIPGKGKVYRVRIHGFATRAEADAYREERGLEGITVAQ
jgi:cell division septation protein DedD